MNSSALLEAKLLFKTAHTCIVVPLDVVDRASSIVSGDFLSTVLGSTTVVSSAHTDAIPYTTYIKRGLFVLYTKKRVLLLNHR